MKSKVHTRSWLPVQRLNIQGDAWSKLLNIWVQCVMKAKILTCRVNISPYILMIEPNLQFLQSVNSVDSLKHVDSLKLSGQTKSTKEDNRSIAFSMFDDFHPLPKYQVTVDLSLGFSVSIYGWFLLDNHPIYLTHKRSVRFTRAFLLLSQV